jgi:PAS domain S-box-containing protein
MLTFLNILFIYCIAILNLWTGWYVYRKNPGAPLNRSFAFTAAVIALWSGGLAYGRLDSASYRGALCFAFAAASLIPLGMITFVDRFRAAQTRHLGLRLSLLALVSSLFSVLSFSPWMVKSVSRVPHGMQPIYGTLHPVFAAYLLICFAYVAAVLLREHRVATGLFRVQLRQVFVAFVVPAGLATVTNVLVPLVLGTSAYSSLGPLFSAITLVMVGHAIIRHRLMDIRVVIRRSAVYLAAFVCSGALFVALLVASNIILPDDHDFSLREIILALIVAALFQPVKFQAQRLFDRYLCRYPYDYARTLLAASSGLTATIDLQTLLRHVGSVLASTVRPEGITVYLRGEDDRAFQVAWSSGEETLPPLLLSSALVTLLIRGRQLVFRDELTSARPMEKHAELLADLGNIRAEAVAPLIAEDEVIGLIAVSGKRSGDPYFSNDADLLTTLANQAAVAIRNAQAHARVLQVNEEMQKVLGTIESGVVAIGPTGRITIFNHAAELLTGASAQLLHGQSSRHLPAALASVLESTAAQGRPHSQVQFSLPSAVGQTIPLVCSTSVLRGPGDTILGAVAILSDMSRLKELEQEKERAERLASFEAIASGLIHEIRNPLVGIKTYAQLLPSRGADAVFREMFSRTANREIGRIDGLLSRFRAISSASQQPMEPVDISKAIRDTLETLHAEMEDRQIRLRQVGEAARRPVLGNAPQLQQLFLNLCLNAIQAMGAGGELTVRVADLSDKGGNTLLIEFGDTGPGIAEELLPTIFDSFVTTKPHGTGLGLAICRGIADAHHARLTARNNVGRPGCTFTVEFPVPAGRPAPIAR